MIWGKLQETGENVTTNEAGEHEYKEVGRETWVCKRWEQQKDRVIDSVPAHMFS